MTVFIKNLCKTRILSWKDRINFTAHGGVTNHTFIDCMTYLIKRECPLKSSKRWHIAYPRQDKKNLTAGNYHRGRLQLCAYATFSATTVQTFPAVQVLCCLLVWTDFADFESVDTLRCPALICIHAFGVLDFLLDRTPLWERGPRKVGIKFQLP